MLHLKALGRCSFFPCATDKTLEVFTMPSSGFFVWQGEDARQLICDENYMPAGFTHLWTVRSAGSRLHLWTLTPAASVLHSVLCAGVWMWELIYLTLHVFLIQTLSIIPWMKLLFQQLSWFNCKYFCSQVLLTFLYILPSRAFRYRMKLVTWKFLHPFTRPSAYLVMCSDGR